MGRLIDKVAWLRLEQGRVLGARSHGKDSYYLPGGKREPGETDEQTLLREIAEELTVALDPATLRHVGTWEAQAHGKDEGTVVRMTCYAADYAGALAPAAEIAETRWLRYADRGSVSPAVRLIFDDLHAAGDLR
ncbi:NUDIX hydrolase [Actinomadura rupiterrae]|uniref:NUDIX hydrolase n=1 Tax=Actinomadura rupiterrae TaxID=559627 RepID=UPI0020A433FC|nr:NUDIX domain-containing protein [Actinomadura rupiterrae]MCP2339078.1 8-oxo-dGTP pyrophosphatase MutT (NUDIX family) [Actinomadura rupiterrae]